MRAKTACLTVAATLLLTGCSLWPFKPASQDKQLPAKKPTAGELISFLNERSDQIGSIRVDDLAVDAHKRVFGVGLSGKLVCQKPRNFRLEAYGPTRALEADVGSNNGEFWFYMARNNPPYLYCRHDDLHKAPSSFPFHPDWMLEALGMGYIPSADNFRVEVPGRGETIELVERTRTPQGQPVFKVTVFSARDAARDASGREPQVVERRLLDEHGKAIAVARILEMQQLENLSKPGSAVSIARKIEFEVYHPESVTLKLTMDGATVNGAMEPNYVQMKFTRPNIPGVQAFDLARAGGGGDAPGRPLARTFRGLQR